MLGSFQLCPLVNGHGKTHNLYKVAAHLTGVAEEYFATPDAAEK